MDQRGDSCSCHRTLGCGEQEERLRLVAEVSPLTSMTWVPAAPAVAGIAVLQVNAPSEVAVAMRREMLVGEDSPVR
jgi:hypothetical protein